MEQSKSISDKPNVRIARFLLCNNSSLWFNFTYIKIIYCASFRLALHLEVIYAPGSLRSIGKGEIFVLLGFAAADDIKAIFIYSFIISFFSSQTEQVIVIAEVDFFPLLFFAMFYPAYVSSELCQFIFYYNNILFGPISVGRVMRFDG